MAAAFLKPSTPYPTVTSQVGTLQKAEDQLLSDFYALREQVAELQRNEVVATSEASEQEMHALKVLMNGMVERSIYDCTMEWGMGA